MANNGGAYNNMHIVGSNNGGVMMPASSGGGVTVNSLRDVCNFLQPPQMLATIPACPYDHIIEKMKCLDLQDDGILMNHKIKSIEADFCNIVHDENMLCESMEYINDKALADNETALKFALLFSSRNFDALAMKETKVRSAMLKILETNFINADAYRVQDKNRLYNSITLLGEYYHRVRLADNSPIKILGKSLLDLLIREVCGLEMIDMKLAKLILSQITLNGDIMRLKQKEELTQLLFHIRRNLIEQPALKPVVKAYLLMTLDLYYSNFANLGAQLEEMYTKYLIEVDDEMYTTTGTAATIPPLSNDDQGNNNVNTTYSTSQQNLQQQPQPSQTYQSQQQQQQQLTTTPNNVHNSSFENGECDTNTTLSNDSNTTEPRTKKWSEQVCEDSLYETDFNSAFNGNNDNNDLNASGSSSGVPQEHLSNNFDEQRLADDSSTLSHNSRRSYKPRNSPRPLKQNYNSNEYSAEHQAREWQESRQQSHQNSVEEDDQTKPLPRWRTPRFNRADSADQHDNRQRNPYRRFSTSFDDDKHSVHSEGGSIRLYSVNDRLKHSQEKIERSSGNFNSIANSNWDRQSQHDDRSERSYASNYERGNYKRGARHYNNRQMYDKPPRFQKNQKDNKIHSDSWRSSNAHAAGNSYHDENSSYPSNGPESNSRSSSRARTLPRPSKSNIDDTSSATFYRRSQSPMHNQYQRGPNNARRTGGGGNNNARYSSQSSLASDASNTLDRRHNQRNRNFSRRSQNQSHQQGWDETRTAEKQQSWGQKNNNSEELVRNARQTTDYMNYLSAKK